jgi:hypothetical protein
MGDSPMIGLGMCFQKFIEFTDSRASVTGRIRKINGLHTPKSNTWPAASGVMNCLADGALKGNGLMG